MVDFRIVKCCANCKQRELRAGMYVFCSLHREYINLRMICEFYLITDNERILTAERDLLQGIKRDGMKFLDLREVFK